MERVLVEYLVNSAWQVPLVAAAAWLGLRVGRPSARMQHGVWVVALGAAVLLPAASVPHSNWRAVPSGAERPVVAALADSADTATLPEQVEQAAFEDTPADKAPAATHAGRSWRLSARATAAVVYLYLAVIALFLLRLLQSCRAARRLVRGAAPGSLSAVEMARLGQCCEELNVGVPEIRQSAGTWSPVVVGVRRPVIVLPEAFGQSADAAEIEAVWWHELVHVSRGDYLRNLLCRLSALPVVYHPAAHFILRRVRRTREMVCDAIAAEKMNSRVEYARCLADLAGRAGLAGATGVEGTAMFGDGALEERVMELLATREKAGIGMRVARAIVSAVSVAVVVGAAAFFHVTPTLAQPRVEQVQPVAAVQRLAAVEPVVQADPVIAPQAVLAVKPVLAVAAPVEAQAPAAAKAQAPAAAANPVPRELTPEDKARLDKQIAEAKRNVDEALKQLNSGEIQKNVDEAIRSVNSAEMQKQIADAMKQAKSVNSPEMRKQIAEAVAKAQAQINSPEFRKRLEQVQEQSKKQAELYANSAEMQKRMAEMQKTIEERFNSPEWKKQMDVLNSPEFKERMEKMQKELQDSMKRLQEEQERQEKLLVRPPQDTSSPELKK